LFCGDSCGPPLKFHSWKEKSRQLKMHSGDENRKRGYGAILP